MSCFLVLVLIVAGCSKGPENDLVNGESSFKAGQYKEAVIYFRNATQANPKLAQAHYRLAQTYLELKSFQPALLELQRTVELDPKNFEAQLQLASLLISSQKYDEAKIITAKVLSAEPNNANAHAVLAQRLAGTGDHTGAVREYRNAIRLAPKRMTFYFALGALYRATGHLSEAETVYKLAVEGDPQSEVAHLSLAQLYSAQESFAQAEDELRVAAKLAPHDVRPLILLANSDLAQKRFAEAEKICLQLKTVGPDDPEAYRALATLYLSTGQREKALSELKSLRASKPKDIWVKSSLGETLLDLNRMEEASAPVQDALALDPNDAKALALRGRILLLEGKYSEARNTLERALKGADQDAAAWFYLGVAQQHLGLSDLSKASFAQAHKLSPRMMNPQVALAELNASGGNYEESERLAAANPKLPQAEVIGARAELAKGNLQKAEQMVQAELERDPSSLPALEILTKAEVQSGRAQEAIRQLSVLLSRYPRNAGLELLLATIYFQEKDFGKSEECVRKALAINPQQPDVHAMLGMIAAARGALEQAVTELQAEIAAHPYRDANYLALADLYERQGKWSEARSTLEKARVAGTGSPYVMNNLAYLYLEHGGDPNVALSLAQEAKRSLPDSSVSADTLGWAFHKIGSYENAIVQCSFAAQKLPGEPEYQYHLGMAYLGARHFEKAAQSLQRSLKINPTFADAEKAKAALDTIAKIGPK